MLTFSNIIKTSAPVKKLPSAARLAHIRERLADKSGVSIAELAQQLGVSEMTVRRDLSTLEEQTHVQRTHGGAVLTETIFSWPGLGRYAFESAVAVDFPAILGITLVVALIYLLVNFLVDMSYAIIDPRVANR